MTGQTVRLDPVARQDLRELTLWLRGEAGVETAERFAAAVIASLRQIPGIGSLVPTANVALTGTRKLRVVGFPRHLIFYRATPGGVRVIRALHAAQDWWAVLDIN